MKISLVILTYNWPAALDRVLASVAGQRRMPDEVLIADDGSGAATADVVRRWQERLPVPLRHIWQQDQGFRAARCRNLGIAASQGDSPEVRAAVDHFHDAMGALQKATIAHVFEMRAVLTPEQARVFDKEIAGALTQEPR